MRVHLREGSAKIKGRICEDYWIEMNSPLFEHQEGEMKKKKKRIHHLCSYMKINTSLYNKHSEKCETHKLFQNPLLKLF